MDLLSELEVARLQNPAVSDAANVRAAARAFVDELQLEPEVNLEMVASARDISTITEAALPFAACLVHEAGAFAICVRASDSPRRKRFSIAHEIGHTFLPGYALSAQFRCNPSNDLEEHEVERLSDLVASEILMPHRFVVEALTDHGPTFAAVDLVSDSCGASLEASASRVTDMHGDALMICLELRTAPRKPGDEPRLRVHYARSAGIWPYMPKHKSFGPEHSIYRCLQGEVVDETVSLSDLTRARIPDARMNARYAPWTDAAGNQHDRVLCLVSRT